MLVFGITVTLITDYIRQRLVKKRDDPPNSLEHAHDCLVHECDFHTDPEVASLVRSWLATNKLNSVVITDHDLKTYVIGLIASEVRSRRALIGE